MASGPVPPAVTDTAPWTPPPGPSAPTRGARPVVLVIAIVAVAVVAFLAGALAGGALSHKSGGSTGPESSPAITYAQAQTLADAKANTTGSGWQVVVGEGIDSPHEALLNLASSGCPAPTLFVPAFSGSASQGVAPVWLFEYVADASALSPPSMILAVSNGTASIYTQTPQGTYCDEGLSGYQPLPSSMPTSPVIAAAAASAGGASYLADDPGATVVLGVIAGQLSSPALWEVEYSACGLPGSGSTVAGVQSTFSASFYATNGTLYHSSTGTEVCLSTTPYLVGFTQGATGTLTSGAYYDNLTVTINAPLPLTDVLPYLESNGEQVYPASGGCTSVSLDSCPDPSYGWYATLSLSGTLQATYPGTPVDPSIWMEVQVGSVLNLESGETLTLVSDSQLQGTGEIFAFLGEYGVAVSGETSL
jgi:hypothetical protein